MSPLPSDRVNKTHPFEVVGIDFAAPLYMKAEDGTTGKGYIVLFTCAVTRAIHLELVSNLSTGTFLLAFRRFAARRGLPCVVYSDNALTFKRAAEDVRSMYVVLKQPEIHNYCANNGISWKFIAERAGWWGGFWELMVCSVKTCLRKTLGKSCFDFDQLTTILTEIEALINSRPLTFSYDSHEEPAVLTRSHFICGKRLTVLPQAEGGHVNSTRVEILKFWAHRQRVMDNFWTRWSKEYLLNLRSAHCANIAAPSTLCEKEIVIVQDDKLPRLFWKTGQIMKCFVGKDGHVRSCKVRLPNGSEIVRPVQLLYLL